MKTSTTSYTFQGVGLPKDADSLSLLVDKFSEHKLVVFPKSYPTDEDREDLMTSLAPLLNWKLSSIPDVPVEYTYTENHKVSVDAAVRNEMNSGKEIVVAWHIEHPQSKPTQVGGLWTMKHMTCDKTLGSTGFVDVSVLYNILDEEDKEFLSHCEIVQTSFFALGENGEVDIDVFGSIQTDQSGKYVDVLHPRYFSTRGELTEERIRSYLRDPVVAHPQTGELLLRIDPKGKHVDGRFVGYDLLAVFDGREPTKNEKARFNKISEWVLENVYRNEDVQYWHYWDEGDTLLVDIFSMAHGVRGGFSVGERILEGIWAFPNTTACSE